MDRLSTVTLVLALGGLVSACDGGKSEAKSGSRSRYEAVEAKADPRFAPDQFCENWQPGGGPAFSFPPLAGGAATFAMMRLFEAEPLATFAFTGAGAISALICRMRLA